MQGYTPLSRTHATSYYNARLYASFPYLMDTDSGLRSDDGHPEPLSLTEATWKQNVQEGHWTEGTESDPYFTHRKEIFKSSAKLDKLGGIWRRFEHQKDPEGEPCQLVFASYFYTGAYIMYLVSQTGPSTDKKLIVSH
jgi:hypothetical protein